MYEPPVDNVIPCPYCDGNKFIDPNCAYCDGFGQIVLVNEESAALNDIGVLHINQQPQLANCHLHCADKQCEVFVDWVCQEQCCLVPVAVSKRVR
jgi:hypothetical protein